MSYLVWALLRSLPFVLASAIHRPTLADDSPAFEDKTLIVRVVDGDGAPLEGAEVGRWMVRSVADESLDEATLGFSAEEQRSAVTTNEQGEAIVRAKWIFQTEAAGPSPIIAWTKDRKQMGLAKVTPEDLGSSVDLVLSQACQVEVTLTSKRLESRGRRIPWSITRVNWEDMFLVSHQSDSGRHELVLPAGSYQLHGHGQLIGHDGVETTTKPQAYARTYNKDSKLRIDRGEARKNVEIDLPPTLLAELIGRQAPEFVQAKGWMNGRPLTLAELKGKVVLLDFWGYWCGPCVYHMPQIFELHERYSDQGLVIIGVHDDSVKDLDELRQRLETVKSTIWDGKDIPYPVMLDGGGEVEVEGHPGNVVDGATCARYGIFAWPTYVLIDKQGVVRGQVAHPALPKYAKLIEQLLRDEPASTR